MTLTSISKKLKEKSTIELLYLLQMYTPTQWNDQLHFIKRKRRRVTKNIKETVNSRKYEEDYNVEDGKEEVEVKVEFSSAEI